MLAEEKSATERLSAERDAVERGARQNETKVPTLSVSAIFNYDEIPHSRQIPFSLPLK